MVAATKASHVAGPIGSYAEEGKPDDWCAVCNVQHSRLHRGWLRSNAACIAQRVMQSLNSITSSCVLKDTSHMGLH